MIKRLPSQERLRELFDYEPDVGALIIRPRQGTHRLTKTFNTRWAGKPVTNRIHGYLCTGVDGERLFAHRIIWKWMTGEEPPPEIDHIDRDRANNRWSNLRGATRSLNLHNTGLRPDNTTGVKGVSPWKKGRFRAAINLNNKHIHLGLYDTVEAASAAYTRARELLLV